MWLRLNHLQLYLVVVFVLVILFILYTLYTMGRLPTDINDVAFDGYLNETLKRNCDVETVYSVEDFQCERICAPPNAYRTKNGVCVNVLAFNQAAIDNECDAKQGLLAYLLGDPEFGKTKLLCLSIDPGIQPDNLIDHNKICIGGNINIDYLEQYPTINMCQCSENLYAIPATGSIREHAFCAPDKRLQPLFDYNNLIVSK